LNCSEDIVFHLYGTIEDPVLLAGGLEHEIRVGPSRFVNHGPYAAEFICDHLRRDDIDVGLHLSVWPETFSYTLSEFAQAGVPVIAGRLGAQGARTEQHALGWTVPEIRDAARILEILEAVMSDRDRLRAARSGMRVSGAVRPIEQMWSEYADTYSTLTREPLPRGGPAMRDQTEEWSEGRYVQYMAARLAEAPRDTTAMASEAAELRRHAAALEELLHSPRHRVATAVADAVRRLPLVKPLQRWLVDRFVNRSGRNAGQPQDPS
jgi:hypothetical protein